jgi:hypothetical protein
MLNSSGLRFDKSQHKYFNAKGSVITGLTTSLKKLGLATDYSMIPKHILDAAKERGTRIHEQCQSWIEDGIFPTDEWAIHIAGIVARQNVMYSEFLVGYTHPGDDTPIVATMVDLVMNDLAVGDIKTTSKIDNEYVSWQCSFSAFFIERANPGLQVPYIFCLHSQKDKCTPIILDRKSDWEIEDKIELLRSIKKSGLEPSYKSWGN